MDTSGESIVVRAQPERTAQRSVAPQWFSNALPIQHSASVAHVSDGWRQLGQVVVQADAAYARDTLWSSFLRVFTWVLVAGLVWACVVIVLIRWLRRALRVEVADRVAGMLNEQPATTKPARSRFAELDAVSQTIDDVQKRVLATSQEQHARIESLEFELHRDEVSGLANRRYFVNELRKALSSESQSEQKVGGHVLLFRQRDLAAISTVMTRMNVDAWLRNVGDQLSETLTKNTTTPAQLARLNGSDFVVLLPSLEGPAVSLFAQQLKTCLLQLRVQLPSGQFCRWAMALTDYGVGDTLAMVLGRLDQALMSAESAGHTEIEYLSRSASLHSAMAQGVGETQWRELIQDGLAQDAFTLAVLPQPLVDSNTTEPHYEATLMLRRPHADGAQTAPEALTSDASSISAYLFMPVAVRLGLSAVCDLRAVKLGLDWLAHNEGRLVLRVSVPSILQARFLEELENELTQSKVAAGRLYLELDAYGVVSYTEPVAHFVQTLTGLGVQFGLRRVVEQPWRFSFYTAFLLPTCESTLTLFKSALMASVGAN